MSFVSSCTVLPSRTRSLRHKKEPVEFRSASATGRSRLLMGIPLILGSLFASHAQVQTSDRQPVNSIAGLSPSAAGPSEKAVSPAKEPPAATYLRTPLSFEPNQGQADPKVRFVSRGSGYSLALTDSAAVLTLHRTQEDLDRHGLSRIFGRARRTRAARSKSLETDVVRMELAGASPVHSISGSNPLGGTTNYFIGNDPSKW